MGDSPPNEGRLGTAEVLRELLGPGDYNRIVTMELKNKARDYFERTSPTIQCNSVGKRVDPYDYNNAESIRTCTKCYICGLPILTSYLKASGMTAQCEHILPILYAAIYLKLYSPADRNRALNDPDLQLEYLQACEICNQIKSNMFFLRMIRSDNQYGGVPKPRVPKRRGRKSITVRKKLGSVANIVGKIRKNLGKTIKKTPGIVARYIGLAKDRKSLKKGTVTLGQEMSRYPRVLAYNRRYPVHRLPPIEYSNYITKVNRPEPIIQPPVQAGDYMEVNYKSIERFLRLIWNTRRSHSRYHHTQLETVYGDEDNFVRCRAPSLINKFQEIANRINGVMVGQMSAASLFTLAGLCAIKDFRTYRDDMAHILPDEIVAENDGNKQEVIRNVQQIIAPNIDNPENFIEEEAGKLVMLHDAAGRAGDVGPLLEAAGAALEEEEAADELAALAEEEAH